MSRLVYIFLLLLLAGACNPTSEVATSSKSSYYDLQTDSGQGYLTIVYAGEGEELGTPCGYVNEKGDTIIPIGKYSTCWSDTIRTFGIVWDDKQDSFIGIDKAGRRLYEVYLYDNGPDWVSDGLFRIKRDGKIGYADQEGIIKIEPRFECANPFENGKARVALKCELVPDGEYTIQQSDSWFYIDQEGSELSD